jgi:hypothetical protein
MLLKQGAWQPRLANDRQQRADSDESMVGNRNRSGCIGEPLLHDDVASSPSYFLEAMSFEDAADFPSGKPP